jgi:CBS domain-containing protein
MLKSVDMQDYMLSNPVKIKADTDIFEAIHQILIYKVSGLCVVDDNNIVRNGLPARHPRRCL